MKMVHMIMPLMGFFFIQISYGQNSDAETTVLNTLDMQTDCWNKGDLDCFMQGYWKSDSLKFIGKKGLNYGWQTTLDNYKKSYPNREAMGQLKFEIKSIEELSGSIIFVVGKWHLERSIGNLEGHFSLVWKEINGKWVIIADHSS